ncbi:response regulator transcription factor [Streptosporangium canum]|uniref:response regulator transcription factor n=1 Tax=Streptosporangium canum TaxID=324952 RepID=UPI0036B2D921
MRAWSMRGFTPGAESGHDHFFAAFGKFAALVLSENTVKLHVRAVLQKLDLRDRVHVVIYAYENGLVARHEFHPDGRYQVHPFG